MANCGKECQEAWLALAEDFLKKQNKSTKAIFKALETSKLCPMHQHSLHAKHVYGIVYALCASFANASGKSWEDSVNICTGMIKAFLVSVGNGEEDNE